MLKGLKGKRPNLGRSIREAREDGREGCKLSRAPLISQRAYLQYVYNLQPRSTRKPSVY